MKKIIGKFLSILLAVTMALTSLPSLTPTATAADKGIITVTAADGITVTDTDVSDALSSAGVDDSLDTYSITISSGPSEIGWNAFSLHAGLTSVAIPASVNNIDTDAFRNSGRLTDITVAAENPNYSSSADGVLFDKNKETLVRYPCGKKGSYTIPNGVKTIGDCAFYSCRTLTGVSIPNTVTTIERFAFAGCNSLANVIIPNSVSSISDFMFAWCYGLASVSIPNTVTYIGDSAFWDCDSLASVTIPASVTSIDYRAFGGCDSLTAIAVDGGNANNSSADGVLFDKNKETLVRYPCGKMGSYTIPDSVKTIGETAFRSCSGLTSVTIPALVASIGERAFEDCTNLTAITVDGGNSKYSSADGVLFDKNKTTLIACPGKKTGDYSIPYGVVTIGANAFYYCEELTNVTIPESATTIGANAFVGCRGLTSVTVSASVTSIGEYAFSFCASLVDVFMWPDTPPSVEPNSFLFVPDNAVIHTRPGASYGNTWNGFTVVVDTPEPEWKNPFVDVNESDWFYGDVEYAHTHELFGGTSANTFSPDEPITLAMLVTVFWRMDGRPVASATPSVDAVGGLWYSEAVAWAAENGIMNGIGGGLSAPGTAVTREQTAQILFNYAKTKGTALTDVQAELGYIDADKISDWAVEGATFCQLNDIIRGKPGNLFDPQGEATRAEAAAILRRFLELAA